MKQDDFQICKSLSVDKVGRNSNQEGGRPSAFPKSQDSLAGFSHGSQGRYTPFWTWGAISHTFTKVHCSVATFISTLQVRNWLNNKVSWLTISKLVFQTSAQVSRIYGAKSFFPNSIILRYKIVYRFVCNGYTKWLARGCVCWNFQLDTRPYIASANRAPRSVCRAERQALKSMWLSSKLLIWAHLQFLSKWFLCITKE